MDLESILGLINKAIEAYFGVVIAFGCIIMLYGLLLLIFNRRVVKALYFIGGFAFFGLLSAIVSLTIVLNRASEKENTDKIPVSLGKDLIIALGCSAIVGLIFGILAACFGRFGIVLAGMSAGFAIGAFVGILTGSANAMFALIILFTIIGGTLCGLFKRPAEVLCSAIMGGLCFGFGYESLFIGVLDLQTYNHFKKVGESLINEQNNNILEKTDSFIIHQGKLARAANISSIILIVVTIICFGTYHIFKYKKNHSKSSDKEIALQKSPAYNHI